MPRQKYTLLQFFKRFPDEDACLDALFQSRFGRRSCCHNCGVIGAEYYRVKGRKSYACMECRHQLYPMAGTIMQKSTTSLQIWFLAIYLFSVSRNNVSAKELQRVLGCTYKTSWRIGKQIRSTMKQDTVPLSGIVEADEAYIGGRRRSSNRFSNKTPLLGVVQRGGHVRVRAVDSANATTAMPFLYSNVVRGSTLHTDESRIYYRAHQTFSHYAVHHGKHEYVRGDDYTNTIEGFWGLLKPSLDGTHRSVSKKYLQLYTDEFVWKYNRRHASSQLFPLLLAEAVQSRGER